MRTLSEHAAYELTKAGMTDHENHDARQASIDTMALVRKFEKQHHNATSTEFVLGAFERLCNFLPISPLTDNPEEWEKLEMTTKSDETGIEEKRVVWRSKRARTILSSDGGKTFYDESTGKGGESVDHTIAEKEKEVAERKAAADKAQAAERGKKPIGHVKPDVPAGEAPIETKATK